jgi:ABC-type multidrug transport system fused ATPase/permease subunit
VLLAQHHISLEFRKAHNDTLSIIYGALYITFGVVVGFTAYLVLDKYSDSQKTAASEAATIVQIYQLANSFHEAQRDQIQQLARSYAREVVDEEWPLMRKGQSSSHARELVKEISESIQDIEPTTDSERASYAQELSQVNDLTQDRSVRLLRLYAGLPPILWIALVVLAAIIVIFMFFIGMDNARLHRGAVVTLVVAFAFIFFTIYLLDTPFGPGFRVGPDAFEQALTAMEE